MILPWSMIAILLAILVVLQFIVILRQRSKIKTLEHYIDIYKNKVEKEVLEGDVK